MSGMADVAHKVRGILVRAAVVVPFVSAYLFTREGMTTQATLFSVIALFLVVALVFDSFREAERFRSAYREAQKQADEYKAQYEDKDKRLHQMTACYNYMIQKHEADRCGVEHEDYMKWSFGDVDAMTPEGRAIMEAHEAKRADEKKREQP